jgi:S-adenosylmethionine:tRNA ribosyltransferase-isomerase
VRRFIAAFARPQKSGDKSPHSTRSLGEFPIRLDEFDYDLPPHLVARAPSPRRDESRLLVVQRSGGVLGHGRFSDLPEWLRAGDMLVLNDTRVLPARLVGRRYASSGRWEGLFLQTRADGCWELLAQMRGRPIVGETLLVEQGGLELELVGKTGEGRWLVRPREAGAAEELLLRHGQVPLPPYIRKARGSDDEAPGDRERYQTIYARRPGAVAAPTAGLHFTAAVFEALRLRGVEQALVTLHVGPGTFQPVQVEDVAEHRMQAEWGELPAETAQAVADCKARGGRVVAVGTTSVRVLETAGAGGIVRAWSGQTDLTIRPPFSFRAVDALVTNFHLPRSSLLLLVAAFMGLEPMRQAYRAAVSQQYRFYSYGDAMLIL